MPWRRQGRLCSLLPWRVRHRLFAHALPLPLPRSAPQPSFPPSPLVWPPPAPCSLANRTVVEAGDANVAVGAMLGARGPADLAGGALLGHKDEHVVRVGADGGADVGLGDAAGVAHGREPEGPEGDGDDDGEGVVVPGADVAALRVEDVVLGARGKGGEPARDEREVKDLQERVALVDGVVNGAGERAVDARPEQAPQPARAARRQRHREVAVQPPDRPAPERLRRAAQQHKDKPNAQRYKARRADRQCARHPRHRVRSEETGRG